MIARIASLRCLLPSAFCLLLAACATTAAQGVVANPDLAATAQMDQYRRDAQATQSARDAEIEHLALEIQMTAQSATSTAQVVGVTQTAIANMQAARAADDATSTHVARLDATATVIARISADGTATQIANAQLTAVSVQATGTAGIVGTQTTLRLTTEQAEAARLRVQTWLTMLGLVLMVVAIAAVCIWLAVIAGRNWRKRGHLQHYGPNHNPILLTEGRDGRVTINDPLASPTPGVTVTPDGRLVPMLGFTAQDQLHAALARLYLLTQQAAHNPYPPVPGQPERETKWKAGPVSHETRTGALTAQTRELPAGAFPSASRPSATAALLPDPALPHDAPWQILDEWWRGRRSSSGGGALPLGLGAGGLLLADPEQHAHLLIAGTTGSGKSRYALKPIVAAALADGWQVCLFDRNGLHLAAFQSHPNAHIVRLDQAGELIHYLDALHAEVIRRFKSLAAAGAESWAVAPAPKPPRLLAVVDDFSILGDTLDTPSRRALWLAARRLAADSRKSGIHLALAVQNPTWQSMDLGLRRNCTPLTFRVQDGEASRVILNVAGAETLRPRHFMAALGQVVEGIAFAPTDDEIAGFLETRPVQAHPAPDWLRASGDIPAERLSIETDIALQVLALHAQNVPVTEIQRRVFGTGPGGRDYYRVKAIISGSKPPESANGE